MVNVFRLFRLMVHHTPRVPVKLGSVQRRSQGATVTIKISSVLKMVEGFSQRSNVNPDVTVLEEVRSTGCIPDIRRSVKI